MKRLGFILYAFAWSARTTCWYKFWRGRDYVVVANFYRNQ